MFRKSLMFIAAFLLALPVSAQKVDEIIANNIKAHGGMEKMKSVKTMRMTGKLSAGAFEAALIQENKRPNLTRGEFTIQGMTAVQAYDGKTGWQISPFQGKKDAELLGPDELKEMIEQADIDGPLVDAKEKGHTIELVGKEPMEGTDAFKLKVTLKNGDVRYYFLDADSFLEIKVESKRMIRGAEVETEQSIGDYKEVEGLVMPFSVEGGAKGSPNKQKVTVDKYEINIALDDSRFKMPEVKPAEAPKAEEKKK